MTAFAWQYPALLDAWIDGDTPICHVGMTPSIEWHGVHVRVEGINAPELHDAGGREAKAYAESLVPPGAEVTLIATRREKYGRFLARIVLADGSDFSTEMIAAGHATPYKG